MLETERLVHFRTLIFVFLSTLTFGQKHPNKKIDSLLVEGIENLILQNYDLANNSFHELESQFPKNPLGNIYLSAVEIARSVDFEEKININYVDSLLDLAKNKNSNLLKVDSDDIWYNYYDALIYGYNAYYYALAGNFISAFADGILSLRGFQKCLDINNDFVEAYIALGTYNYWKSAQSKGLLWIPFIPDNRDEGIEYLEKAIESNSYNKYLAAYSLVWIYIDYGKSSLAADLSLQMIKQYPKTRFFKWGLARAYQDIDKIKAIEIFSQLLTSIESIPNRNQFNDIVLMHKLAMLYNEIDDNYKSLEICNQILNFKFKSDEIKERLEDRIERTENLKEELEEILN